MKKELTKPEEVVDYVSQVDYIIEEIENQIKTVTMNEFGVVKVSIPGEYLLKDKQEVASMYQEIGWGRVTFSTAYPGGDIPSVKTVYHFKKK